MPRIMSLSEGDKMVLKGVAECIKNSWLIAMGKTRAYFFPIAIGSTKDGRYLIFCRYHRTVVDGARTYGERYSLDELHDRGKFKKDYVVNVSTADIETTRIRQSFPALSLRMVNVEKVYVSHPKSRVKPPLPPDPYVPLESAY